MKGRSAERRVPFVVMALLLVAGCTNTKFVYKPGAPAVGAQKLPVKVAVLPFKDGTENFTHRMERFLSLFDTFNLVKSGIPSLITAVTPELWAKSFADDMTGSGGLQATRFLYSLSELTDEEFFIEGTVKKANSNPGSDEPNEFALGLRAMRRGDSRQVWEKEVVRAWKTPKTLRDGCGFSDQCRVDRYHAGINRSMHEIFAEARADLIVTLAALSGGRSREAGLPSAAGEATRPGTSKQESVEQTIDRILEGK